MNLYVRRRDVKLLFCILYIGIRKYCSGRIIKQFSQKSLQNVPEVGTYWLRKTEYLFRSFLQLIF